MDRDLSDFKWYLNTDDNRKYLVAYVDDTNAKEISELSKVFTLTPAGALQFGIFHFCRSGVYVILDVDRRMKKNIRVKGVSHEFKDSFEAFYKPLSLNKK